MKPGDLRYKITILYNAAAGQISPNGSPVDDWQPLVTAYAKREGVTGRLFYQAAAYQMENDITFTIRFRSGIKAGMRVIEGSDTFEIKVPPADLDGRRSWLEIRTRQVLQNGG